MATTHKQIVGKYELGKVLAAGYFDSRTRICTHIVTGAQYVVRIYSKDVLREAQWMWDRTRDSIQVMRTMPKHENIIETTECFETESSLYILMQMFSPMQVTKLYTSETPSGQRIPVPLQKTKHYFMQVVRGLVHMHKHGVVHLGIAPDHVMINDRDQVKIGYLVSCTYFPRGKRQHEIRGTTHTVAPEILRNDPYDPYLADAWSMGVLLYFMLHKGRYPHDGANTTKNILYNRLRPSDPSLPSDAVDLLSRLLHPIPSNRMAVEDIPTHPFLDEHTESGRIGQFISAHVSQKTSGKQLTENPRHVPVPYEINSKERAAYLIQRTYRAYRQKRQSNDMRRGTSQFIPSYGSKSNGPRRSKMQQSRSSRTFLHANADAISSMSLSCREKLPEYDDDDDDAHNNNNNNNNGDWANPSDFFPDRKQTNPAARPPRRDERAGSASKVLFSGDSESAAAGSEAEAEAESPSAAALGGQRRLSEARRARAEGRNSAAAADGLSDDSAAAAAAAALAHVKVDAARPCPLCRRMPMQRLGGQAPYKTPFVFENGEFTLKPTEED